MSARANSSKVVPARTVVSTRFDLSGKCVDQDLRNHLSARFPVVISFVLGLPWDAARRYIRMQFQLSCLSC